ncbi:peptidase M55 D-aminopeptidase [Catenulispora acidiphila DSM 44928]|uniref:Peptidase M55 D-aminopeptidase n=1 Tax=Catenulispora acidiphila (strain DSM 44928 / JCM 14897 / NBRC 102108 / NRRL B-24433 / ID139908) TaxID=479433 RepID=C7QJU8_CATAD|nr:M55 family metallopeptidase [Catenulispora acidiphila]ACU73186.1 peptidase M55 D-aminopeptidase [Catenulispora acidiphila DSM 44928]
MKIFISSDMEGTAGVVNWDQCRPGQHDYEHYRALLQDEVNAAIDGANRAGGPHEFLVNDSHGRMANLRPEQLHGEASYLSGHHKPLYMMQGLDESFDAVFFVSYHGSASGSPATLSHTYNPAAIAEVRLNGALAGESGINSLVAHSLNVPVVLVTGDQTTASELRPFWPEARAAVVKQSVSRFAAESLHPARATRLIEETAREAITALRESGSAPAAHIETPSVLTVRLRNPDLAEMATWLERVEPDNTDPTVVHLADDDLLRLYRTFITLVVLTRGIAE